MKSSGRHRNKFIFAISVFSGCLLLLFQNCSQGFTVKEDIASQESILDYARKLDQQYLSSLLISNNVSYWEKDALALIDNTPAFATDWSVIAVVNDVSDGNIISINSGVNSEESRLAITGGKVVVANLGNSSNYYDTQYENKSLNATTVFAFSSGPKISNSIVLVDGYLQKATPSTVGSNLDFSLLAKSLDYSSSRIKEIVVYPRALNAAELNVMSRYLALKHNLTAAFDPAVIEETGGGGSVNSPQFVAALAVINSRCLSCHSSENNGDFRGLTASKAIRNGLIRAGDLSASKLYYRLSGSSTDSGPKNMPVGGTIPPSEVQAVKDWILSIQ